MLFPEMPPIQQCIYKMKQHTQKNKEGKKSLIKLPSLRMFNC